MRLSTTHTAPHLRTLDRVETVTWAAIGLRFSTPELVALISGQHVDTGMAVVKEVR